MKGHQVYRFLTCNEANAMQERALRLYRPTEHLDPALIRLDQATCLVFDDQADAGCELAASTLRNAAQLHRTGLLMHYGHEFYNGLSAAARRSSAAGELQALLMAQA